MYKASMMKKNITAVLIICGSLTAFYSCKRDYTLKSPYTTTGGKSYLRIVDAAPNFRNIFNFPDTFNVLVNGIKVTAYTPGPGATVLMTYGSIYPTVSSGYGYVAVDPGPATLKLFVGTLIPDSVKIASFVKNFAPDKYYTFMITDSVNSTKDSSQIFVQDIYPAVPSGYYNLRFIHAVLNDTAGKTIDIWPTRANRYIYTNVKPGMVTSFSQWAYNPIFSDTLYVRRSGNPLIALDTLNSVSFSNQRTYTLYYRGDGNSNLSTNIKKRRLATYVHQ